MNTCHIEQMGKKLLLSGPINFSNAMQWYEQVSKYLSSSDSSSRQIVLSGLECDDSSVLACLVLWRRHFSDVSYHDCPLNIQEVLTLSDLAACLSISPVQLVEDIEGDI